jgi:hypothetical protein
MKSHNSLCYDVDEPISDEFKYKNMHVVQTLAKNKKTILKNAKKSIINTENTINSFLSPFKLEIKGHGDTFNNNNEILDNDDESKLCSLVETIYNNNNVSGSLVKSITDEYGNCFTSTLETDINFISSCKESCYIQESQLKECAILTYGDINDCSKYNTEGPRKPIHIEKNGLYYNCSYISAKGNTGATHLEIPCNPKKLKCNGSHMGIFKTCEDYHSDKGDLTGICENYHMQDENNDKHYNCVSDNTIPTTNNPGKCVKSIKGHNNTCHTDNFVDYNSCKQIYTL